MRNLFVLFLFILLFACSPQKEKMEFQVFDLVKNLDLMIDTTKTWNDFASSVSIVPLETKDSALLASFSIQDVVGNYIIGINRQVTVINGMTYQLGDGKADVRIFNEAGKLVRTIDYQGKGAKEYPSISALWIEEEPVTLKIISDERMFVYDLEGNYLKTNTLEKSFGTAYYAGEGKYVTEVPKYPIRENAFQLNIIDGEGKVVKEIFQEKLDSAQRAGMQFSVNGKMIKVNGGVWYKNSYCDTVYQVTSQGEVSPVACFPSGDYGLGATVTALKGEIDIQKIVSEMSKCLMLGNFYPFGDKYFVSYSLKGKGYQEIWEKGSDKPLVRSGKLRFQFDDGGSIAITPELIVDNKAYFLIDAYKVMDHVEGVNEESNPVLIILTLK